MTAAPADLDEKDTDNKVTTEQLAGSPFSEIRSSAPPRPPKDNWDKIAAVAPIISGALIFLAGSMFTSAFNQQQIRLQEIQTIEKFIPHLMGNEQSKKASILAISSLTNAEMASKFAAIFASSGTMSALNQMATNGNDKEKTIANKALTDALENLAERESKLSTMEATYKQSLDTQKDSGATGSPDYIFKLTKLGEAYMMKGEYQLAEPLLKKSLEQRQRLFGADHPEVAEAYRTLAELYSSNGSTQQAEECMHKAKAIETKIVPSNHPDAAPSPGKEHETTGEPTVEHNEKVDTKSEPHLLKTEPRADSHGIKIENKSEAPGESERHE